MQAPKALEQATRVNLDKPLKTLLSDQEEITVTDDALPISIRLVVSFHK